MFVLIWLVNLAFEIFLAIYCFKCLKYAYMREQQLRECAKQNERLVEDNSTYVKLFTGIITKATE